jgi:hypothetical protein
MASMTGAITQMLSWGTMTGMRYLDFSGKVSSSADCVSFEDASMQCGSFVYATMQGPRFVTASMQGASFTDASMC